MITAQPSISFLAIVYSLLLVACGNDSTPNDAFQHGEYESSFQQYEVLAEAGDTDAANYLGIHYYLGLGTPKDYERANEWFLISALAENADAMRNLGVMYMRGFGFKQDWARAYGWLYHAAEREHPTAQEYIGVVMEHVTPNKSMQQRALVAGLIKEAGKQRAEQ